MLCPAQSPDSATNPERGLHLTWDNGGLTGAAPLNSGASHTEPHTLRLGVSGPQGTAGLGQLEVLAGGAQVHPLRLSEHQEGAQPQAADGGHQVEQGRPGARGLDQVTTQAHAHDTCTERGGGLAEGQADPAPCTGWFLGQCRGEGGV